MPVHVSLCQQCSFIIQDQVYICALSRLCFQQGVRGRVHHTKFLLGCRTRALCAVAVVLSTRRSLGTLQRALNFKIYLQKYTSAGCLSHGAAGDRTLDLDLPVWKWRLYQTIDALFLVEYSSFSIKLILSICLFFCLLFALCTRKIINLIMKNLSLGFPTCLYSNRHCSIT